MFKVSVHPIVFRFAFETGTSRGVLKEKTSWFIRLEKNGVTGWGECSPIAGLSPEPLDIMEDKINTVLEEWKKDPATILDGQSHWREELNKWPALRFALETAWLDYSHGGVHQIYRNGFFKGQRAIPINGLVWMNTLEHMQQQIEEKLEQGYRCIKLKIGHHDFHSELALLQRLRERFDSDRLMIRVDANGAYKEENVFHVLDALASLSIHSIEQPVTAGNLKLLSSVCARSPIAVALDEELIPYTSPEEKETMLQTTRPAYLVLKPSLHGGMMGCREWIALAEKNNIGWWMTSYLESGIGLNAIAQFTCEYNTNMYHGLGTGQIYTQRINSPLAVQQGLLTYLPNENWSDPTDLLA
ncbi:MAG: chloromuconate cycloisomerase [Chitinophagaceae bacterium]|nr:chloromuconate cycloisomerase [Chitinophagaceae bacterium]